MFSRTSEYSQHWSGFTATAERCALSVLKLYNTIWISAEHFPVSRNLAENSNSPQNMANPYISRIFYLARFIFVKLQLGSLTGRVQQFWLHILPEGARSWQRHV